MNTAALLRLMLRSAIGVMLLSPMLASSQPSVPEEIVIVGRVPGPPMWQVRNGDNTLWLFGVLSPLPKNLAWDSTKVEAVLARADGFLPSPNARPGDMPGPIAMVGLYRQYRKMRKLDNKQTLEDLLSANDFQRLTQIQATYGPSGSGVLRLRPFLAAQAFRQAAMKTVGLRDAGQIYRDIGRLFKKYQVSEIATEIEVDASLKHLLTDIDNTPMLLELACLQEVIAGLSSDIAGRTDRALAWSYGQVADLYDARFMSDQITCDTALTQSAELRRLRDASRKFWLQKATQALENNSVTFAVLELDELLTPDGLLAALGNLGYEIVYP